MMSDNLDMGQPPNDLWQGSTDTADEPNEHWGRHFTPEYDLKFCLVACRQAEPPCLPYHRTPPAPRKLRCPHCYGRAKSVGQWRLQLDPPPGRGTRLARWLGEWFAAFHEAATFPFRREDTPDCALCKAHEDAELAAATLTLDPETGVYVGRQAP